MGRSALAGTRGSLRTLVASLLQTRVLVTVWGGGLACSVEGVVGKKCWLLPLCEVWNRRSELVTDCRITNIPPKWSSLQQDVCIQQQQVGDLARCYGSGVPLRGPRVKSWCILGLGLCCRPGKAPLTPVSPGAGRSILQGMLDPRPQGWKPQGGDGEPVAHVPRQGTQSLSVRTGKPSCPSR